jgi:leucyl-tRNA synthetase
MINYNEIEAKWQKRWADEKVFEVDPNDKEGLLVTAAFPYVNMPQHIGHLRTYATTDLYARYKRMRGFNVLYPMAFHATGTPVLAIAKRVVQKDPEIIQTLQLYHVPDEEILKMNEPTYIVRYFSKIMEDTMRMAGYGIDWRRKFISIEPLFSRMVEWQFKRLNEEGLITKGEHPVGWCTNENNAVGQHDTKNDVQPEIEAMTVIKFKEDGDAQGICFDCATLRPETIYGVTNVFVKEDLPYVVADIAGEKHYLSSEAARLLSGQMEIKVERQLFGRDLIGKKVRNPLTDEVVPVLPGFFVKGEVGTGIVMSVPSHAPFDYVALERLRASGYALPKMEYKKVIGIETVGDVGVGRSLQKEQIKGKAAHPEIPALACLEVLNADPTALDETIELATKTLYREESRWGRMIVGKYTGKTEPEAREAVRKELIAGANGFEIFVISNVEPVMCRCGALVTVKLVKNQWFINYGDSKWKDAVRKHLATMKIYSEKMRSSFNATVEWIDARAAEREQGLGTRFPFNENHIIESLSDSTIYMSFYTYVHILRSEKITPEQLKPEFFDYVVLGKGTVEKVAETTGIPVEVLLKCGESFSYWYGNTSRHSGLDLVTNHLTMYIFNHVGLLQKKNWPRQIVVNALVNCEGQKMSKSMGNIIPLSDGIRLYGSDPLRFVEITGADLDTDTEFSPEAINGTKSRNEYLVDTIRRIDELESSELRHIDYWLYSVLNSKIKDATAALDELDIKAAYTRIYYESISQLKIYFERGGENHLVVSEFLQDVALMLGPAMPHLAEELWQLLGNETLVVRERWPSADESMISVETERMERVVSDTISDISHAIELTSKIPQNKGKRLQELRLIIADDWKAEALKRLAELGSVQKAIEAIKTDDKERVAKFLSQLAKNIKELKPETAALQQPLIAAFNDAAGFIGRKFQAKVVIEAEAESKSARAGRAAPDKPSIDLTWG